MSNVIIKDGLEIAANVAAILTAVVATLAYVHFIWGERRRRLALEAYLREERRHSVDEGRRTVTHLMAHLSMTEAEVLKAGFQSKIVEAIPGMDEQGRAVRLYFQHGDHELPVPTAF
jgi:hypothetical protein